MKKTIKCVAFAAAMAVGSVQFAHAETKLLFSTFFPKAHTLVADVLEPWAEAIRQETNGEVVIEFAAASLAPPPGQLDMVEKGIADISVQFTGLLPNRLTPYMITEVPGPVSTTEAMSVALWRTYEKHLSQAGKLDGLHVLSTFSFPPQWMFGTRDQRLETLDQLKQAKIATTPGSPASAYGSVTSGVIAGPVFRYFELVSKGMVDAYVTVTPIDVLGFNLLAHTKTATDMGDLGTSGSFVLVINERKWRGLSQSAQESIARLSGEAFARRLGKVDEKNAAAIEAIKGAGVSFAPLSSELSKELGSAFAAVKAGWVEKVGAMGVDGEAALKFYREAQKEAGGS